MGSRNPGVTSTEGQEPLPSTDLSDIAKAQGRRRRGKRSFIVMAQLQTKRTNLVFVQARPETLPSSTNFTVALPIRLFPYLILL